MTGAERMVWAAAFAGAVKDAPYNGQEPSFVAWLAVNRLREAVMALYDDRDAWGQPQELLAEFVGLDEFGGGNG